MVRSTLWALGIALALLGSSCQRSGTEEGSTLQSAPSAEVVAPAEKLHDEHAPQTESDANLGSAISARSYDNRSAYSNSFNDGCPAGTRLYPDGWCHAAGSQQTSCPPGYRLYNDGLCHYDAEWAQAGRRQSYTCPPGYVLSTNDFQCHLNRP